MQHNPIGPLLSLSSTSFLTYILSWKKPNACILSKELHLKWITKNVCYFYNNFLMFRYFLLIVTILNLLFYVQALRSFFFPGCILAILKPWFETFYNLISNISTKLFTSSCGILSLNITFMLAFFQKSNNEPCNCVTNFFQNLSLPTAHTKCYTLSTWEAVYSANLPSSFPLN